VRHLVHRTLVVTILVAAGGCRNNGGVDPHLDRAYPDKLSDWRLFTATRPALNPNAGVLPYQVNTPLFSDYADKFRTVWMPSGQSAEYRKDGVFAFPVGTILTKTFSFRQKDGRERLIETRLIVRQPSGWVTLPYIWNREQTEAMLDISPLPVPVEWVDAAGTERRTDYTIPNVNQCSLCHDAGAPLGLQASYLNRGDQLVQWTRAGYLKGAPDASAAPRAAVWNDPSTGSVERRALAYLEVNCATCHRAGTRTGQLDLHKGAEILARMESLDPKKRMPTLGHTVAHREAVQLIREWALERQ
jgi:uncharacterized repeat protein (TIGR03806 family)